LVSQRKINAAIDKRRPQRLAGFLDAAGKAARLMINDAESEGPDGS
jgi:hypothetical protein